MKEIGAKLKEARENIDITIEEAANDLKMTPTQIEDIESGNVEAFSDILYLKYFIRDYSKYLGLNYDDLVDEFNEYLFDYTSKISLAEIKEAKKDATTKDKKENKMGSPYTLEYKLKPTKKQVILITILILAIIGAAIYLFIILNQEEIPESNVVTQGLKVFEGGKI